MSRTSLPKEEMVPLSQRDAVLTRALADRELAPYAAFVCGERQGVENHDEQPDPHLVLLHAIEAKDKTAFKKRLAEIAGRTIRSDSEWVENDCLVFLLLLGCEEFSVHSDIVDKILSARERNTNPVAVATNGVFRALSRREFGMEGRFCFIKVVFLELLHRLDLSRDAAAQAYDAVSTPGLISDLIPSPFLQVLAIRAFDLLVSRYSPSSTESFADAVNVIHRLAPTMNVKEYGRLLAAIPGKLLLVGLSLVASAGALIGGYGYHAFTAAEGGTPRSLPERLTIRRISDPSTFNHDLLNVLSDELQRRVEEKGESSLPTVRGIETEPFGVATRAFWIELATLAGQFEAAYALVVEKKRAGFVHTVVPARITSTGIQVLVPESSDSSYLLFLTVTHNDGELRVLTEEQIVLRVLDRPSVGSD